MVLADSSKIGARAELQFCALEAVDILITDTGIDQASLRLFADAGIETIVVDAQAAAEAPSRSSGAR